jgi:hypothetical protein
MRYSNWLPIAVVLGAAVLLTGCDDQPKMAKIPVIDVNRSPAKDVREAAVLKGVLAAAELADPPADPPADPADPKSPQAPNSRMPRLPEVHLQVGGLKIDTHNGPRPGVTVQRIDKPSETEKTSPVAVSSERTNLGRTAGLQPALRLPKIRSAQPQLSKEVALDDALNQARLKLMHELQLLDEPIVAKPSKVTMRNEYIKGEPREILPSPEERQALVERGLRGDYRWVEIDLELTEDQVQKLRSSDRVTTGFRGAAMLFALILAIYGFLRLDEWTKGYLTTWIGLGAVAIVMVAAIVFIA